MRQDAGRRDIIDVLDVDFQVVDRLGAGTGQDRHDASAVARGGQERFVEHKIARRDEVLFVLAPDRMVRRDADRLVGAPPMPAIVELKVSEAIRKPYRIASWRPWRVVPAVKRLGFAAATPRAWASKAPCPLGAVRRIEGCDSSDSLCPCGKPV